MSELFSVTVWCRNGFLFRFSLWQLVLGIVCAGLCALAAIGGLIFGGVLGVLVSFKTYTALLIFVLLGALARLSFWAGGFYLSQSSAVFSDVIVSMTEVIYSVALLSSTFL